MSQPVALYGHASASCDPWKVAIILEELGVNYKMEFVSAVKVPLLSIRTPMVAMSTSCASMNERSSELSFLNRVPTIEDPNAGIMLWESGASIEYGVDVYDRDSKLDFTTVPEKYHLKQFLHFQVSGQGPHFGQAAWIVNFYSDKPPSAIERYKNELKRVTKVLDAILKKKGDGYLVGGKCTYADVSFVTWAQARPLFIKEDEFDIAKECLYYDAWMKSLVKIPSVKKVFSDRDAATMQLRNSKMVDLALSA